MFIIGVAGHDRLETDRFSLATVMAMVIAVAVPVAVPM